MRAHRFMKLTAVNPGHDVQILNDIFIHPLSNIQTVEIAYDGGE
jgi:hypothetical protein